MPCLYYIKKRSPARRKVHQAIRKSQKVSRRGKRKEISDSALCSGKPTMMEMWGVRAHIKKRSLYQSKDHTSSHARLFSCLLIVFVFIHDKTLLHTSILNNSVSRTDSGIPNFFAVDLKQLWLQIKDQLKGTDALRSNTVTDRSLQSLIYIRGISKGNKRVRLF